MNKRIPCSALRFRPNEKNRHILDVWINGTPSQWALAQNTSGVVFSNVRMGINGKLWQIFRDDPRWSVLFYTEHKGWQPTVTGDWDYCIFTLRGLITQKLNKPYDDDDKREAGPYDQ